MILSDFPEEKIDEMISRKGLAKYTEYTIVTKEHLMQELDTIRKQGNAYDNQECELGARCIALPINDYSGHVIASISVTGPVGRMTDEFIQKNLPVISGVAKEISYQFGFQP